MMSCCYITGASWSLAFCNYGLVMQPGHVQLPVLSDALLVL